MFKEFKTFIARGNVIDLAIAVVIGAAFGKIVTSLVEGIVMPPIGLVLGKVDFTSLFFVLDTTKGVPVSTTIVDLSRAACSGSASSPVRRASSRSDAVPTTVTGSANTTPPRGAAARRTPRPSQSERSAACGPSVSSRSTGRPQ